MTPENIGRFYPESLGQYFSPDSGLVYDSGSCSETRGFYRRLTRSETRPALFTMAIRNWRTRSRRSPTERLWYVCVLTAIAAPVVARAEILKPDARASHDGVTLDAYSRSDRVTFCFSARENVKIASEYGVPFKVPDSQVKFWDERMPKLHQGSEPYFDLPVQIDLKTRGATRKRQVSIDLGVCVSNDYCTSLTFEIVIPASGRTGNEPAVCPAR